MDPSLNVRQFVDSHATVTMRSVQVGSTGTIGSPDRWHSVVVRGPMNTQRILLPVVVVVPCAGSFARLLPNPWSDLALADGRGEDRANGSGDRVLELAKRLDEVSFFTRLEIGLGCHEGPSGRPCGCRWPAPSKKPETKAVLLYAVDEILAKGRPEVRQVPGGVGEAG